MANPGIGHGIQPGTSPLSTFTEAAIDFSISGNNNVVPGLAGKNIFVYRLFFVCAAPMNIKFYEGANALTGSIYMIQGAGLTLDFQHEAWFHTTASGNAFIINTDSPGQVSGRIYYQQY